MNRKINIILIIFIILVVISFGLMIFLKFDNFINGWLLSGENQNFLIFEDKKNNELNKNNNEITISYNSNSYSFKIEEYRNVDDKIILFLDKKNIFNDNEKILQVFIKMQSKNIFGF